ncbi:MAG: hypothetical protein ABWX84_12075 [Nocardioides sp.]
MSHLIPLRLAGLVAALVGLVLVGTAGTPATGLPAWQDTSSSWSHPAAVNPKVVGLRYAAHPTFDRVVIDLRGRIPSGTTTYRRHFTYDGSGDEVPILGRSGIQLTLTPAAAHNDAGDNLYTGPTLARPRLRTLKALALTGDFEGQVTFAFALTHRAKYRVFELSGPRRLVIDFQHR